VKYIREISVVGGRWRW